MAEFESSIEKNDEDISLLDLLVVLIRYRKFIIFSTLIVSFLVGIWFFIILDFFKKESEVLVIYSANIEKMSPELSSYLNLDLPSLCEKEFRNYFTFANVHKPYNIFTDGKEELTARQYNTAVKKIIDERKKFSVNVNRGNNSLIINAEIPESKVDSYKSFVKDYVDTCSVLIESSVFEIIESAQKNLDELIEKTEKSEKQNTDLANLMSVRLSIKNFFDTHKNIVFLEGAPFEADIIVKKGRTKKFFTSVIIVFIVSVFVSYILNYISNIKKDEKSSKLVSDAWKAGK